MTSSRAIGLPIHAGIAVAVNPPFVPFPGPPGLPPFDTPTKSWRPEAGGHRHQPRLSEAMRSSSVAATKLPADGHRNPSGGHRNFPVLTIRPAGDYPPAAWSLPEGWLVTKPPTPEEGATHEV